MVREGYSREEAMRSWADAEHASLVRRAAERERRMGGNRRLEAAASRLLAAMDLDDGDDDEEEDDEDEEDHDDAEAESEGEHSG